MRVLVTGANGHLATFVIPYLKEEGHEVVGVDIAGTDINKGDVTSVEDMSHWASRTDACIHLAGLKYPINAEVEPILTSRVNIEGTMNVCRAFGDRVVTASTCKAADPETVYGCSKLIAERITLGAGGRVVRLVNVLGSPNSVTDIWKDTPPDKPIGVCDATRMFMSGQQAAMLFVHALGWPAGRYAVEPPPRRHMLDLAGELHPDRNTVMIPLRRGDRRDERLLAACEEERPWAPGVIRIIGPHDPKESRAEYVTAFA